MDRRRDLDLGRYMPRLEAQRTLGLQNITVLRVGRAGLIRYVNGSDHCFPNGYHFLREDVMKIKEAFEKHGVLEREYSKPGTLIALYHALKNYLGRDLGLPAVIRAVIDDDLVPVGYIRRFPGVTGYVFLSEDLRKYRPVADIEVPRTGFFNYREAASVLGVKTPVIRGLVAQGSLAAPVGYRPGLSKLIPAADVQSFADRYVAATILAKRFNLSGRTFSRDLKASGMPLLAVPIPEESGGQALFVPNDMLRRALSAPNASRSQYRGAGYRRTALRAWFEGWHARQIGVHQGRDRRLGSGEDNQ